MNNPKEQLNRLLFETDCKIVVSMSGGKDSLDSFLTVYDMLDEDASRFVFLHHNVDGAATEATIWDYPVTEDYCRKLGKAFGIPVLFSYREGGIQREIYRKEEGLQDILFQRKEGGPFERIESRPGSSSRGKFPARSKSLSSRWCSSVVKIDVASGVLRRMFAKDCEFVFITGERKEEDNSKAQNGRASYAEVEYHRVNSPRKNRLAIHWRPSLDHSESDVWLRLEGANVRPHPAYYLGRGRTSCRTCIFCSKNVWATMAENNSAIVQKFEQTEEELGFTLFKGKTIRQVAESGTSVRGTLVQREEFDYWNAISNSCVYPLSIFVDGPWELPVGAFAKESCGSSN